MTRPPVNLGGSGVFIEPGAADELTALFPDAAWVIGPRASDLFFFQAEDGIPDYKVTGVQTCALPIYHAEPGWDHRSGAGGPGVGAEHVRRAPCLPSRTCSTSSRTYSPACVDGGLAFRTCRVVFF